MEFKMKILVTGHKGYIGRKLFSELSKKDNAIITGIDLKDGKDILLDLPNEDYDFVFHLAAFPRVGYSYDNPSFTFKNNCYATSVLLEWAKNHKVKRFIFSSSSAIYGDGDGPISPYGLQKLISEKECKFYSEVYGLDTVSLRYYNVYSEDQEYGGSYSTVISSWIHMIKSKQDIKIYGDGNQIRDFIHVNDIISANIFCMESKDRFDGIYYDVGSNNSYSINDIKKIILSIKQFKFINEAPRQGDVKVTKLSNQNLMNLGWKPQLQFEEEILKYFSRL